MKRMLLVILVMAFSTNVPTPIFPLYQAAYGLTTAMITMLYAIYAVGVLVMLLAGGSIAERLGARPVAFAGAILAIISAVAFLAAKSPVALFAGRLIGGFAVGSFTGTSNAILLQMTPPGRRDRILGLSATLNLFGFGLGPALGGTLVRYAPSHAMDVPFVVLMVALGMAIALLLSLRAGPELPALSGPTRGLLEQRQAEHGSPRTPTARSAFRLGVPPAGRALFWGVVGPAVFTGFAFAGMAFALLPGVARATFGTAGRGLGGLLVFVMTTTGALVQLAQKPSASPARLGWGLVMLGVGSWLMILGESLAAPVAVLSGALLEGAGNGWAFQASLRLAGVLAERGDRVQVMSTYFLCGYAGLSIPVVATGELSRALGVIPSMAVTGILLSGLLLLAISFMRRAPVSQAG